LRITPLNPGHCRIGSLPRGSATDSKHGLRVFHAAPLRAVFLRRGEGVRPVRIGLPESPIIALLARKIGI
jgi:hypothetical protein